MNNQKQEQPVVSQEPKIPEEQTKKAKPKWLIPVIVIVGIIVLGAAAWGTYTLIKPGPSRLPEGEEAVEEEKELPEEEGLTEEEDEFADWKTYRNEEYGFEFKYPKNWPQPIMAGGYLSGGFPQEKSQMTLQVGIIGEGPCEGADCSQYEVSGFSYLDYESALISLQKNKFISELEETEFNDLKIITYVESGLRADQTALIFGSTQTLKFVNVWGEEKYFNQILSTFKFLE